MVVQPSLFDGFFNVACHFCLEIDFWVLGHSGILRKKPPQFGCSRYKPPPMHQTYLSKSVVVRCTTYFRCVCESSWQSLFWNLLNDYWTRSRLFQRSVGLSLWRTEEGIEPENCPVWWGLINPSLDDAIDINSSPIIMEVKNYYVNERNTFMGGTHFLSASRIEINLFIGNYVCWLVGI